MSDSNSKSKKTRQEEDEVERFSKFLSQFNKESDRAAVILGAAKLEEALYQLLCATFLPAQGKKDELLEADAPLGTFASRIEVAFRLGLIDSEFSRALNLIRKIRNSFAHESGSISLAHGAHGDRIRELIQPFRKWNKYDVVLRLINKSHTGLSSDFRAVLTALAIRLDRAVDNAQRIQSKCTPMFSSKTDSAA